MQILHAQQIRQKVKRIAYEVLENNYDAPQIFLAGVNNNGLRFAEMIHQQLSQLSDIPFHLLNIRLNPAAPLSGPIQIDIAPQALSGETVIVVDDVANTGRTLFYAFQPLMHVLPKKVEAAVLVDRKHKFFPIHPNYVGLSLATTLNDNIEVNLEDLSAALV